MKLKFKVSPPEAKTRLDQYLTKQAKDLSRSRIQALIKKGRVFIQGKKQTKISYPVKREEIIRLEIPPPRTTEIIPEKIPLEIIYEDKDLLVINKRAGIVMHQGAGNKQGTLVNALLYQGKNLSQLGGEFRPGIVHRLDKDTSGLIVVAKNDPAHISLSRQFKERRVHKTYLALVKGVLEKDRDRIEKPLGRDRYQRKKISPRSRKRREAITEFRVLKRFAKTSLVALSPLTGRTHQIRVHLSLSGHPILGDRLYGRKNREEEKIISRQALHAWRLSFFHPRSQKELKFSAPLPADFRAALKELLSKV